MDGLLVWNWFRSLAKELKLNRVKLCLELLIAEICSLRFRVALVLMESLNVLENDGRESDESREKLERDI